MEIHLDTSFLIRSLLAGTAESRSLDRWVRQGETIKISAMVWAEFLCGPVGPSEVDVVSVLMQEIVPYTAADCEMTARLFNLGGRRRGSLPDCMIAAVAVRAGGALATANPGDFRRFGSTSLSILEP